MISTQNYMELQLMNGHQFSFYKHGEFYIKDTKILAKGDYVVVSQEDAKQVLDKDTFSLIETFLSDEYKRLDVSYTDEFLAELYDVSEGYNNKLESAKGFSMLNSFYALQDIRASKKGR